MWPRAVWCAQWHAVDWAAALHLQNMHCCSQQWRNLMPPAFFVFHLRATLTVLSILFLPLTLSLHVFLHSFKIIFCSSAVIMCVPTHHLCILPSTVKTHISQLWALFEAYYIYDMLFSHSFNHFDISFHALLIHLLKPSIYLFAESPGYSIAI